MKITLQQKFKSLAPFSIDLPDFVVLTGVNGAGKTQILTAIQQPNLLKVYDNEKELTKKKYVTSHSLSPNESSVVTREQLNQKIQSLWQQYSQFKENRQRNPNLLLEQSFSIQKSAQYKVIDKIARNANKNINELTLDDFFNHYPLEDGLQQTDVFYQNFSSLFKRYQDKLDDNEYREYRNQVKKHTEITFLTKEEFEKTFGEAPWDFVNKIIKEANLDYNINSPVNSHRDAPFELKLVNNYNGVEIKFGELSSGEKVLMSLALALYNSNFDIEFPKVLLMDEPDASLHPSM